MRKRIEITPDADQLLAIFAKDSSLGYLRYQEYLYIYISYDEYVKFVRFCVRNGLDILAHGLQVYSRHLHSDRMLARLFLADVAEVVLFELYTGWQSQLGCINIRHTFGDVADTVRFSECAGLFSALAEGYRNRGLDAAGFYINSGMLGSALSRDMQHTFCYGLYLKAVAAREDMIKFNVGG